MISVFIAISMLSLPQIGQPKLNQKRPILMLSTHAGALPHKFKKPKKGAHEKIKNGRRSKKIQSKKVLGGKK